MQIKGLEMALGVDLFDRSFRPPNLTPIGKQALPHVERILGSHGALENLCKRDETLTGTYKIGLIATASVRLLPGFLKKAADLAPKAEFLFETALSETLEARVQSGILDAAVVSASPDVPDDLIYQEIQSERLVFAMPKSAAGSDFGGLPFLQFNPKSGIGKLIARYSRSLHDNTDDIVLDSVEAIMECVKQQIGYTILAEPDVRRYASEDIIVKPIKTGGAFRVTSLATRSSMESETRARLHAMFC